MTRGLCRGAGRARGFSLSKRRPPLLLKSSTSRFRYADLRLLYRRQRVRFERSRFRCVGWRFRRKARRFNRNRLSSKS